ncbi:MAG: tetratricopeptide (TPR) repeat protein [Cyclobacteriaceae bacterium]|jgi:tetratricopeptide (TPR) repeat protein
MIKRVFFIFLFSSLCVLSDSYAQDSYRDQLRRLDTLFNNSEFEQALAIANRLVVERTTVELLLKKSQIEVRLSLPEAALQSLSDAIRISPNEYSLYLRRGQVCVQLRLYDQAISDLTKFLDNPSSETTAIFFGIQLNDDALVNIKTNNMMRADAHALRGQAYEQLSLLDSAARDFEKSVTLGDDPNDIINLALVLAKLSDTAEAITVLHELISKEGGNQLAWYNLLILSPGTEVPDSIFTSTEFAPFIYFRALEAIEEREWTKSKKFLEKLIESHPEEAKYASQLANVYYLQKDYEQALLLWLSIPISTANRLELVTQIGNTYFKLDLFEQAVSQYEQVLVRQSASSDIWFNAAVAYSQLKDLPNMCRCLQMAIALGFENPQITRMLTSCK